MARYPFGIKTHLDVVQLHATQSSKDGKSVVVLAEILKAGKTEFVVWMLWLDGDNYWLAENGRYCTQLAAAQANFRARANFV